MASLKLSRTFSRLFSTGIPAASSSSPSAPMPPRAVTRLRGEAGAVATRRESHGYYKDVETRPRVLITGALGQLGPGLAQILRSCSGIFLENFHNATVTAEFLFATEKDHPISDRQYEANSHATISLLYQINGI
ncbi:hypothetical protein PoB_003984100 [Plakobranchus ocellatus]|uniref:Uncharacterized protein n=1 Tax=Plakobranchus ocellatus TaxID=259542 RepID=A0AAV4B3D1_9GAST|nr:hypothetical protein PoB_003984100 [Plakobranchus ocellatus]